jgi:uncharacterized membrane protein
MQGSWLMAGKGRASFQGWALVAILLLGFALRLHRLGADSLWYDETVSVHLAAKSIPALVAHTAGDIHPPGYYLLLHVWVRLAGLSEFATAYLSLFFGLVLVALAYRLAARFFDWRVGLLAAFLVAVSPYNLWYSQEVRMYTLGAALGLGLLAVVLSLATEPDRLPPWSRLALYALFGALGLWTLYYFAFLLIAVNLVVGVWCLVGWRRGRLGWAWLGRWLLAQGAVLLLYAPWIPVAWRQAAQPPVPPWRDLTGLGDLLADTWTALSLGQSVEPAQVWPALLVFALLFALGFRYKSAKVSQTLAVYPWILAGFVLIPVFLIYLASFITPLYHVRYAFTYSTPFYILIAAGLVWLGRRWWQAMGLGLAVILVCSGFSIYAYHADPSYASDDHRAATHFLADRWRPGDVVLVNAGYTYPALLTYWNGDPIAWRGRLPEDYGDAARQGPVVVQTGTVDGDPSLGWGDPESDFFAMSRAETVAALERLFADFDRVWVYRIYDTVTDPDGSIRRWLREHGTQFEDLVFTGEGQLRVQGFLSGREPLVATGQSLDAARLKGDAALIDGSLRLEGATWSSEVEVGEDLDLTLVWRVDSSPPADVILFAAMFDQAEANVTAGGQRWAQVDERPLGTLYPPAAWSEGATIRTPLRVPVAPGTPPGRYRLEVGWYRFVDGQPVWLPWPSGQRLLLGEVDVLAPWDWSSLPLPPVAYPMNVTIGDGVQLLGFDAAALEGQPGDTVEVDLYWQALQDSPGPGMAVLQLTNDAGGVLAEAAAAPLGGRVPFKALAATQTLRDPRTLTLPGGLAPGIYNLSLGRRRADGTWLPVRRGPFPLGSTYPLATIRVTGRPVNLTAPAIQHPVDARFGTVSGALIRLVGYDLDPPTSNIESPPSNLHLTLHWQALSPMATRYKIFAHLVGQGDPKDIRAQADVYPSLPTTSWTPGEYVSTTVTIDLPHDLAPGLYGLLVGLYDRTSGERLRVLNGAGGESSDSRDSLLLQEFPAGE